MFSGYIIGRTQFITMVNAAAWFPLLLLLAERLVSHRSKQTTIWLGIVLAIQFLAGHAQLWFYGVWFLGGYLTYRSMTEANIQQTIKHLGELAIAGTISVLLSAVQILPTAEFILHSARNTGVSGSFALTYSLWPWRLITLLAPDFFGNPATNDYWGYANYWEDHAYIGVLPFLLALIAIWHYGWLNRKEKAPKDRPIYLKLVPFFIIIIPTSLLLALGWNTPIYLWVFEYVPGFSYFQAPARLLIWYTLAISILAGIGFEVFELNRNNSRFWQRVLTACLGITIAGIAGYWFLEGHALTFLNATIKLGLLLTVSIILLLLKSNRLSFKINHRYTKKNSLHYEVRPYWSWLIITFITVDLLSAAFPLIPMLPAPVFAQTTSAAQKLSLNKTDHIRIFVDEQLDYETKFNQYFRFETFGSQTVENWQQLKATLIPNLNIYAGIPSANNDDPLKVARWEQFVGLLNSNDANLQAHLLSAMGVTHFISDTPYSDWPIINKTSTNTLHHIPNPLPRAYFVSHAYQTTNEDEVVARLTDPEFDPYREVVIMVTSERPALPSLNLDNSSTFVPIAVNEPTPRTGQAQRRTGEAVECDSTAPSGTTGRARRRARRVCC
ncbi:MAG: hypothetical protein AAF512_25665, partial [Pseudomonadota bacterium]